MVTKWPKVIASFGGNNFQLNYIFSRIKSKDEKHFSILTPPISIRDGMENL